MTKRTTFTLLLLAAFTTASHAQSYRNQDAAIGGIAGAVIGGIIGHQNDETPEGALIGGAVGAVAGGVLGNAKDQQQQRYYRHQAQNQAWRQQQVNRAVSIGDVVNMSRSGLSDSVIVNHIRTNGVTDQVGTHQIISMHNSGVSEQVITAMQSAPRAGTYSRPALPQRETVIVERTAPPPPVIVRKEVHVVPPVYRPQVRVRYGTRPAFPTYPSRGGYRRYW